MIWDWLPAGRWRSIYQKLILAAGGLVLAGVFALGWYSPSLYASYGRLMHLQIGDHSLAIPSGFVVNLAGRNGDRVRQVDLLARMPNLEPYTDATRQELLEGETVPEHPAVLITLFGQPASLGPISRQDLYYRAVEGRGATAEPGPFGLKRQRFAERRRGDGEIYTGAKADGGFYWVQCWPRRGEPVPRCLAGTEYSPLLFVHYMFLSDRLAEWQSLEEQVLQRVRGFEDQRDTGA